MMSLKKIEYMNPSSCLVDLDCQWLATDLNEVQEGTKYDYVFACNNCRDLGKKLKIVGFCTKVLKITMEFFG